MRGNRGRGSRTRPGSRTGRTAERVGTVLGSSFASLGITAKIREYNIKKAWAGAVGSNISMRAVPVRLMGTVLYCAVASSPWMTELVYQKPAMIAKLNMAVGEAVVTDIVFRVGRVEAATVERTVPRRQPRDLTVEERAFIEDATSAIKDDGLKAAIKRAMEKSMA